MTPDIKGTKADRRGSHERAVGTEASGHNRRVVEVLDPRVAIELGLRGGEERLAEAERDRPGDCGETNVEQRHHRRERTAEQEPGALDRLERR